MHIHKVYKNGNSLKLCLPQSYALALNITHQTHLKITMNDQRQIILEPLDESAQKYAAASKRGQTK